MMKKSTTPKADPVAGQAITSSTRKHF